MVISGFVRQSVNAVLRVILNEKKNPYTINLKTIIE